MDFPWLERSKPASASSEKAAFERRCKVACEELASRAGLMYRLGYTEADATKRLCERIAWEFETPTKAGGYHRRPDELSDAAIGKIVTETYARRPRL